MNNSSNDEIPMQQSQALSFKKKHGRDCFFITDHDYSLLTIVPHSI